MSSSLNSRIVDLVAPLARRQRSAAECGSLAHPGQGDAPRSDARRSLLLALAGTSVFGWPVLGQASTAIFPGLKRWGSGEFRRFGFLVYEATLWAGDDPERPPLALRLDYKRQIEGRAIAEASTKEMRRFVTDEQRLAAWETQMRSIFPDVRSGDHIIGVYLPEGAQFYQNNRLIGTIDTPGFAAAFFAIWLDARTSAPDLRSALLRRRES